MFWLQYTVRKWVPWISPVALIFSRNICVSLHTNTENHKLVYKSLSLIPGSSPLSYWRKYFIAKWLLRWTELHLPTIQYWDFFSCWQTHISVTHRTLTETWMKAETRNKYQRIAEIPMVRFIEPMEPKYLSQKRRLICSKLYDLHLSWSLRQRRRSLKVISRYSQRKKTVTPDKNVLFWDLRIQDEYNFVKVIMIWG